jgi:hypothetical protein
MRRFAQVSRARRHRMQDAALTLFAQVLRITDLFGDPLHQSGGLVRIELIGDKNPWRLVIGRHRLLNVVDEIHFGARSANGRGELFAGRHFVIGDQALRTVTNVFVFVPLTSSRLSGDAGLCGFGKCGALQRLNTGLFIRTHQMDALRVQLWRAGVYLADRFDLGLELRRIPLRRVEPTFGVVQIKVDLILKNARQ